MNKLKEKITQKVQDLGDSFMSDDINMEDMDSFVISPYDIPSTSEEFTSTVQTTPTQAKRVIKTEDEIIDSIDAAYFVDSDDFEAIDYELKKLYDVEMCYEDISRERLKLKSQLNVISKKVAALIKEKTPSYASQIVEMDNINFGLGDLITDVRTIRSNLAIAKTQTRTCLGLIANERKREMLRKLHSSLLTIKTFYETEHRIWGNIEEGKFPLALTMVTEAQDAAKEFLHINCVSDVVQKMSGMQLLLESKLQSAFSSLALVYDTEKYTLVYDAFSMLDKTETLSDIILDAFSEALTSASHAVLADKLMNSSSEKEEYGSLCAKINHDDLHTVMNELGFVLSRTLFTYHTIIRFHSDRSITEDLSEKEIEANKSIVSILFKQRETIFAIAEKRIETLIEARDFSAVKFDHILGIVDMITRFQNLGEEYFSRTSNQLTVCIERQLQVYFVKYHKDRMEELFMFIENESFTLCPVSSNFTIFDLQDFAFLRIAEEEKDARKKVNPDQLMPATWTNPFSQANIKSRHTSTVSDSRHTECYVDGEEELQDALEDSPADAPSLCNTALNLLRYFGRYFRMTSLLPSIANGSLPAVAQLFQFFFISMITLFESGAPESTEVPPRLSNAMKIIQTNLGGRDEKSTKSSPFKTAFLKRNEKSELSLPSLCPAVHIGFVDNLFGAESRIIAIQSIEFVARQLDLLRPVIEGFYTSEESPELDVAVEQFYEKILPSVSDVRLYLTDCMASRAVRCKTITSQVSSTNWDIGELRSQHSPYVDQLVKEFEAFSLRLSSVGDGQLFVSDTIRTLFWQRAIYYAFKALVQGYCEGGKCSTEGRALMQLDFQMILIKLESISGLKPTPHSAYVDGYIKAFYLPESGLEQWINSHNEYSSKQLLSLLSIAAHVSKKAKTRIINSLEGN